MNNNTEATFDPEKALTSVDYVKRILGEGVENAKTKKVLYKEFEIAKMRFDGNYKKGDISEESFDRLIKKVCERARKNGFRIIHAGNKGIFIARDEKEFQYYKRITLKVIVNQLKQLAELTGISFHQLLRNEFFPPNRPKRPQPPSQLSLLEDYND